MHKIILFFLILKDPGKYKLIIDEIHKKNIKQKFIT